MERRKPMAVFLIVVGLLILVLVALNASKKSKAEETGDQQSVQTELPDADITEVPDSKSEAISARLAGRNSRVDDYYDSCKVAWNAQKKKVEDPMETVGGGGFSAPSSENSGEPKTSKELFGESAPAGGAPPEETRYRETPAEREARHQRRRTEAMEMANEMSGRGNATEQGVSHEPTEERITLNPPPSAAARRSGVISSLGGTGGGVSSLQNASGAHSADSDHPFRCVFLKDEKLKSGQRVSVRLLEDMIVGPYIIPKNTHLQAYATIDSRLELEVSSIEIAGHIISLGYVAYDTDGVKGIYCPDAGDAKRTVKSSGLSTVGSVLGGRVGRIAGEVVNTGVSIAQNSAGERTVNVPAGYNFFIVKKKQQ